MEKTKELALCSVLAAIAVVLLCIGGVIPIAFYLCPILASAAILIARESCRKSYVIICFIVSAILGIMLCPDKECAITYAFLGWYPLVQPRINKINNKIIRIIIKGMILIGTMGTMYALLFFVIGFFPDVEEIKTAGIIMTAITCVLGVVLFFMYDRMLVIVAKIYNNKRKKKRSV